MDFWQFKKAGAIFGLALSLMVSFGGAAKASTMTYHKYFVVVTSSVEEYSCGGGDCSAYGTPPDSIFADFEPTRGVLSYRVRQVSQGYSPLWEINGGVSFDNMDFGADGNASSSLTSWGASTHYEGYGMWWNGNDGGFYSNFLVNYSTGERTSTGLSRRTTRIGFTLSAVPVSASFGFLITAIALLAGAGIRCRTDPPSAPRQNLAEIL